MYDLSKRSFETDKHSILLITPILDMDQYLIHVSTNLCNQMLSFEGPIEPKSGSTLVWVRGVRGSKE